MHTQTFLSRTEAVDFLARHGYPVAKSTLNKLASIGGGPVYRRFGGRALYEPDDLLNWAKSRTSPPLSHYAGGNQ